MKRLLTTLILAASISIGFAQAPYKMTYQSVVRDASNNLVTSSSVGTQISILQGSATGTSVYTETHNVTSNANGLVTFEIGNGTVVSGDITTIDWGNGPYFIMTEMDPTGGTSYTITGTSELVSVPYALHAMTSGDAFSGDYNDLINAPATLDLDSTNELNTGAVLNGTDLEITDAGGTITVDLSSLAGGGSGVWGTSGTNINNLNTGNVGIGTNSPQNTLSIFNATSSSIGIGNNGFNNALSGQLIFQENVNDASGVCGFMYEHDGNANTLSLYSGCYIPSAGDTILRYHRSGTASIKRLRVGNLLTSTNPLSVVGNSDFTGDMVVTGNLTVTGNIAKGGGTFKIDHPTDPANKFLVHSFVESPEMMNVYSGNIVTDANGYATVELPEYFEAANKDFRYQLTVIGSFAQAIIKEKISGNKFIIQTNESGIEVSWQVTGVRNDAYANKNRINPVQDKETPGTYIHPELFQQDKSKSVYNNSVVGTEATKVGKDGQK